MSSSFDKRKAQQRLDELHTLVQKKLKNGTITNRFMDGVEAEADNLMATIKKVDRANALAGAADMYPVGVRQDGIDSGKRINFKGLAAPLSRKMLTDTEGLGAKTLAPSGAAVTPLDFMVNPVSLGQPATALLDVLPTQSHSTGQFAYLRQLSRDNQAAVVADGALKPTSSYSVTRIEQTLSVIAHLSEGTPRFWFADNDALQSWLTGELVYGLQTAVEDKVFTDIDAVSGKQTQGFSTSALQTIRKSITKLEVAGWDPSALVMHPSDWETVELALASTSAVEYQGLPYDPASRRLFGIPVVTTVSATAGMAHALAADAVALHTDNLGISLQWSETSNADDFARNLIRARCEGRFATAIYRPTGIVVATITAGS